MSEMGTSEGIGKLVLFTDLDGTLLDDAYSFTPAIPALERIREKKVPCIVCSSKTRSEIEHYRRQLSNNDPFISENGGAIFVPQGYLGFRISDFRFEKVIGNHKKILVGENGGYEVVQLGEEYSRLRAAITGLRSEGFPIRGFGDMSAEEVAGVTGLSLNEAAMAKEREFDEPFLFDGDDEQRRQLPKRIEALGLHMTQGQFYHLLGDSDKGKAVSIACLLFHKAFGGVMRTAALGDGPNDLPMLEAVDCPIVVRKADGSYHSRLEGKGFTKADGIGPEGWNTAVLTLLEESRDEGRGRETDN
jgi:mannosyl-3-phosphoglycerate phosphatase